MGDFGSDLSAGLVAARVGVATGCFAAGDGAKDVGVVFTAKPSALGVEGEAIWFTFTPVEENGELVGAILRD